MSSLDQVARQREVALVDLVDRLLAGGVVISGDITLSIVDVDLVYVGLRALITSVEAAEEAGFLSSQPDGRAIQVLWVYAIADRPSSQPPRRHGLAQAPLESIVEGALMALVSRHEHAPSEPAPDALWVHERVVEQLMLDRAVLPMRFGTVLADEPALRAVLEARQDDFAAALDHVRGRVELGVRAVAVGDAAVIEPRPVTGRDYLQVKLGRTRTADGLHEPLARLSVDARRQPGRGADELLRAAYLVARENVPLFRSAVDRLAASRNDVALLCTGPWPPYAFTTAPGREPVAG